MPALFCLICGEAVAATVVVNNVNAPGEGFNSTTPVSAVSGNPATTLGAQRLAAFQAAANAWGSVLVSAVTITVNAQMTSLNCSQNSATLGSAGPTGNIFSNFPGAPVTNTWFPQALHNAIRGLDGDAGNPDISANFNQNIGTPGCLEFAGWSYVIGVPAPPGTISFFDTVTHEIGHGLGFLTFVDKATGVYCCGSSKFPDHYSRFLLDETPSPTLWTAMNDAGRAASAIDNGNLTWSGASVASVAGLLSAGRHASGRVRMYAPTVLAGGSSVSHWDTALTPNEIMEPSLQSVNQKLLTNHLMLDIGWKEMLALAVTMTDGQSTRQAGSSTTYTVTISNNGPGAITLVNAGVVDSMPAALTAVSWSCGGTGGATCGTPSGSGSINTTVKVPLNGVITFTINATINAGFSGSLSNTVTVSMPANIQNTLSSSATDQTTVTPAGPPPGITVSAISGNTTEAGGTATFTVKLDTQPAANVTIGISSSDPTEGASAPSSLVFGSGNWSTPQQVTVTGINDDVDDGDVGYNIITAAASSSDGNYNGINAANEAVTNIDDDTAGITVSAISGSTTEAGGAATFTVKLNSQPTASVTIGLSSSDITEGVAAPDTLVFGAGDWNTPKQATVSGVDDDLDDGNVAYSIITAAASSSDGKYHGLNAPDVAVINLDNGDGDDRIFIDDFE